MRRNHQKAKSKLRQRSAWRHPCDILAPNLEEAWSASQLYCCNSPSLFRFTKLCRSLQLNNNCSICYFTEYFNTKPWHTLHFHVLSQVVSGTNRLFVRAVARLQNKTRQVSSEKESRYLSSPVYRCRVWWIQNWLQFEQHRLRSDLVPEHGARERFLMGTNVNTPFFQVLTLEFGHDARAWYKVSTLYSGTELGNDISGTQCLNTAPFWAGARVLVLGHQVWTQP